MSYIKKLKQDLIDMFKRAGYEVSDIDLTTSNRPELGDFQINDAMRLAKIYGESPVSIAGKVKELLDRDDNFTNVNIAGPGFINLSISDKALIEFLNILNEDVKNNIDVREGKKLFLDYGGANIAKTLHVGHLRSANIGGALKRLAKTLGDEVISDVHFGDIGRQSGMVISEIKRRYPDLKYFAEDYNGEDVDFEITADELGEIYPKASLACKEDEDRLEEVRKITMDLENGHVGYAKLWEKIKKVSIEDIKSIYLKLNTDFDLWEGETDCYPYIPEVVKKLKDGNYLYESEGALVMDIALESDNSPMPPLVVIKSNGATLYATRELATIYSRVQRFNPDEFWYVTDFRQGLYFEQVFRASKKSGLVNENTELKHLEFGTMNGPDGKPFKTRDGGVMDLKSLIALVVDEATSRLNPNITDPTERKKTAEQIALAALKYADFLPFRTTDYIFDPGKFVDLEGKTGPYLLYSTIRIKSLLNKSNTFKYNVKRIVKESDRDVAITLLSLPNILDKAYEVKSLNDIAEYLYKLTSAYNKFYAENRILSEGDEEIRSSWLALSNIVKSTNEMLLTILGIEVPDKM